MREVSIIKSFRVQNNELIPFDMPTKLFVHDHQEDDPDQHVMVIEIDGTFNPILNISPFLSTLTLSQRVTKIEVIFDNPCYKSVFHSDIYIVIDHGITFEGDNDPSFKGYLCRYVPGLPSEVCEDAEHAYSIGTAYKNILIEEAEAKIAASTK